MGKSWSESGSDAVPDDASTDAEADLIPDTTRLNRLQRAEARRHKEAPVTLNDDDDEEPRLLMDAYITKHLMVKTSLDGLADSLQEFIAHSSGNPDFLQAKLDELSLLYTTFQQADNLTKLDELSAMIEKASL